MTNRAPAAAILLIVAHICLCTSGSAGEMHTVNLPDGSVYHGETVDGMLSGHGSLSWTNGSCYRGQFTNGMAQGTGTITYASGAEYSGDVLDGLRHGMGRMTLADGSTRKGYWYRDRHIRPEDLPVPERRHSWGSRLLVLAVVGGVVCFAFLLGNRRRRKK